MARRPVEPRALRPGTPGLRASDHWDSGRPTTGTRDVRDTGTPDVRHTGTPPNVRHTGIPGHSARSLRVSRGLRAKSSSLRGDSARSLRVSGGLRAKSSSLQRHSARLPTSLRGIPRVSRRPDGRAAARRGPRSRAATLRVPVPHALGRAPAPPSSTLREIRFSTPHRGNGGRTSPRRSTDTAFRHGPESPISPPPPPPPAAGRRRRP